VVDGGLDQTSLGRSGDRDPFLHQVQRNALTGFRNPITFLA